MLSHFYFVLCLQTFCANKKPILHNTIQMFAEKIHKNTVRIIYNYIICTPHKCYIILDKDIKLDN